MYLAAVSSSTPVRDALESTRERERAEEPVKKYGATTVPTLPFTVNTNVSASEDTTPSMSNSNPIDSPAPSAKILTRYSGLPAYGPNGGGFVVSCSPRGSVPTSALSVPDDCSTPLSVTRAVTDMLFANLDVKGGGGEGGGNAATSSGVGGGGEDGRVGGGKEGGKEGGTDGSCEGGGGDVPKTGGGKLRVPVRKYGATTVPTLPFTVNTNVSASEDTTPSMSNSNPIDSPSPSA